MRTLLTSTLLQVGRAKFSSSLGSSLHKDFYPAAPRALMNCPILHSLEENVSSNIGTFYSIPSANFSRILTPIVKPEFARQLQVFNDYSFLIRQPAIDMIQKIRKIRDLANNSHRAAASEHLLAGAIVPRFVLHGQPGSGISVQMAHVAHFAASENWLIFHFSDKEKWLDKNPDKVPSCELHQKQHQTSEHPGNIFDLPARSVTWLNKFISMNKPTLEKWNPVLSRSVEWASSDILPIGTPWIEVIDYAIKRSKYASDCIGILLRELRATCSHNDGTKGPSGLLAIDGVNLLWARGTRMSDSSQGVRVPVDRLAIVNHLRRALRADWKHGALICSLTPRAAYPTDQEQYTPG